MNTKQKQVAEKMIRGRFAGLKAAARRAVPTLSVQDVPYWLNILGEPQPPTVEMRAELKDLRERVAALREAWRAEYKAAQADHAKYSDKLNKIIHFLDVRQSQAIEKLWLSDLPEARRQLDELVSLDDLANEMRSLGLPSARLPKELPPVDL